MSRSCSISSDGCQLTCLAMVLRLLAPKSHYTTPKSLNKFAHSERYYSLNGISLVPLYADLVQEASHGQVQLFLKEEYRADLASWKPRRASNAASLIAYRRLPRSSRRGVVLMIKTGTYDDTFASHYVLVDPENPGNVADDNVPILDPAQPIESRAATWRLGDSANFLRTDKRIDAEWRKQGIEDLQIGGIWAFGRWRDGRHGQLGRELIIQMARDRI